MFGTTPSLLLALFSETNPSWGRVVSYGVLGLSQTRVDHVQGKCYTISHFGS